MAIRAPENSPVSFEYNRKTDQIDHPNAPDTRNKERQFYPPSFVATYHSLHPNQQLHSAWVVVHFDANVNEFLPRAYTRPQQGAQFIVRKW